MPCEDTYTLQQNIWLMMQGSTEPLSLLGHCQVLSEKLESAYKEPLHNET